MPSPADQRSARGEALTRRIHALRARSRLATSASACWHDERVDYWDGEAD